MRETTAIREAREYERDPYARRFTYPQWNRTVTVTDVPQLFARLPEFSSWDGMRHWAVSVEYLRQALADERVYADILRRYERLYGCNGSLISGGFYPDWPEYAKEACRYFANRITRFTDRSLAHWLASGRRDYTWREQREQYREKEG